MSIVYDYVLALARRILQFSDRTTFLVALQLLLGNLAPGRQFWFASATAYNSLTMLAEIQFS